MCEIIQDTNFDNVCRLCLTNEFDLSPISKHLEVSYNKHNTTNLDHILLVRKTNCSLCSVLLNLIVFQGLHWYNSACRRCISEVDMQSMYLSINYKLLVSREMLGIAQVFGASKSKRRTNIEPVRY